MMQNLINDYVIEVPQIENLLPDRSELLEHAKYKITKTNPTFDTDWDKTLWYSYNDNTKIKEVCGILDTKYLKKPPECWICYKKEGAWLRPHIDVHRRAVLVYPIDPVSYTLEFTNTGANDFNFFLKDYKDVVEDDFDIEYKYNYTKPTIFNTQKYHSVSDRSARIALQISLYYDGEETDSWQKIVDLYMQGKLLNE